MHPKIAIVGRPNVGKSSLLNMLAHRLISIVDPTPGVTRDRVSTYIQLPPNPETDTSGGDERPYYIELIDTGGYGIHDVQDLSADVEHQIDIAISEADMTLCVVDAQDGIVALDTEIARLLRKGTISKKRKVKTRPADGAAQTVKPPGKSKPILLIANKVDGERMEPHAAEASRLGLGEPVLVSAKTGHNQRELIDRLRQAVEEMNRVDDALLDPDMGVLLAIVGKRNAGKSSIVNAIAGQDRVIVSQLEGTTRDSVDVRFEMGGRVFTAIDTAGLRRTGSVSGDIEYYGQQRSLRSIRRADVVVFVIDATVEVSHVDAQINNEILAHHKPTVLVVNKWDLARGKADQDDYAEYLTKELRGLDFAPIVFTSALENMGLDNLVAMAFNLHQQAGHRVGTSELNAALEQIMAERPPTSGIGRQPRIYYLTQADVHPPTISMFVNDPNMFDLAYRRFLVGRLRDTLPYAEVPIKLEIRARERKKKG